MAKNKKLKQQSNSKDLSNSSLFSEEWLKEITEDAISDGYIALDHLPYIMAKEEGYIGILPKRWIKYQLGLRGTKKPKFTTERDRIGPWQALFYRWAFGKVGGVRDRLKAISFLPVHSRNEVTGKLEEYDLESMDGVCYVKLDELGEYLTKIIKILLPPELFPNHKNRISSREPPTEKKLRPSQRHKIECRKIAKILWEKDPTITIADMIYKDELNKVLDGKTYSEKTIRSWIKDLCPNRSPGRRPKKN